MANTQINIGANGKTTLATAGKYCDRNIDVNVAVPASGITPTGTKSITANGEHDVTNFAKANVNVPIPSGYIKPSGTASITTNGTHDVTSYASANVNVPIPSDYIKPSGTKSITSNGTVDVTNYASASVNVPVGVFPSGTKTITANGTVDVTNFASAMVNVQGLNARVFTSTVTASASSGSPTILEANDFIASIRSNANAFVIVRLLDVPKATAALTAWFVTNAKLAWRASSNSYNAVSVRQSATYEAVALNVNGLTGENYSGHLCVASNGRLYCYPQSSYPLIAGTYQIIAGTMEMI